MSDYTAYDSIYKFPIDLSRVGPDNLTLLYLPKGTRLLYATAQAEHVVVYGIVNLNEDRMEGRRLWVPCTHSRSETCRWMLNRLACVRCTVVG